MSKLNSVLVTGGAGYVGTTLAKKLSENGYHVRIIDSLIFGRNDIDKFLNDDSIEFIQGDIRDKNILEKCLEEIDCVFHLAAVTGPLCDRVPEATRQINVNATSQLIELSKAKNVKRFFFSSTCSNYGSNQEIVDESTPLKSLSLYSETKITAESLVLQAKNEYFEPCVLRFSTVYGISPKMRLDLLVHELILDALIRKKITVFGSNYWRPLIHVQDVAKACLSGIKGLSKLITGQVYNVGDFSQNFQKGHLAELVKEHLPQSEIVIQELREDPRNYRVSFEKIKKNLKFKIEHTVQDGILEIIEKINDGSIDPTKFDSKIRSKLADKISVFNN